MEYGDNLSRRKGDGLLGGNLLRLRESRSWGEPSGWSEGVDLMCVRTPEVVPAGVWYLFEGMSRKSGVRGRPGVERKNQLANYEK